MLIGACILVRCPIHSSSGRRLAARAAMADASVEAAQAVWLAAVTVPGLRRRRPRAQLRGPVHPRPHHRCADLVVYVTFSRFSRSISTILLLALFRGTSARPFPHGARAFLFNTPSAERFHTKKAPILRFYARFF